MLFLQKDIFIQFLYLILIFLNCFFIFFEMEFSVDNDDEQNRQILEYNDWDMNYCETEVTHDQIKTLKKEKRNNLIKKKQ